MHTDAHSTCNGQMVAITIGEIFSPAMLITPTEAAFLSVQLANAMREASYARTEALATAHEYHALQSFENEGGLYV